MKSTVSSGAFEIVDYKRADVAIESRRLSLPDIVVVDGGPYIVCHMVNDGVYQWRLGYRSVW